MRASRRRRALCWLNLHRLCVAPWERGKLPQAACLYCGARYEGRYDPANGATAWRRTDRRSRGRWPLYALLLAAACAGPFVIHAFLAK
jgi:hypothetical protein